MSDLHNEILDNFCLWTVTEFESESRAVVEAHYLEAEKNKLSYSSALGMVICLVPCSKERLYFVFSP